MTTKTERAALKREALEDRHRSNMQEIARISKQGYPVCVELMRLRTLDAFPNASILWLDEREFDNGYLPGVTQITDENGNDLVGTIDPDAEFSFDNDMAGLLAEYHDLGGDSSALIDLTVETDGLSA